MFQGKYRITLLRFQHQLKIFLSIFYQYENRRSYSESTTTITLT